MKSMTGYGYEEYQDTSIHITIEIKSYNNRYLDLGLNLPPPLSPLEPRFREYFSSRTQRGRVELCLRMRELEENLSVILDKNTVLSYIKVLEELKALAGLSEPLHLSHLLKMEGILKTDKARDLENYWEIIRPLLEKCFRSFEAVRLQEGKNTETDIMKNIAVIEENLALVERKAASLEDHIKETIRTRFYELLKDGIDENRVLTETAVLLLKYGINEEIVRMKAHLQSFRTIAAEPGGVGKKLDFLAQELNREINTIGSKSSLVEINHAVVSMKDALENIREQLRNIE